MSEKNKTKLINISKRLSDGFKKLENLPFIEKKVALNKAAKKSIPYPFDYNNKGSTRGVENEQVFIFKIKDSDINIAFSINEIANITDDNITVSIKFDNVKGLDNRGVIISSDKFNYEFLKENLNKFIKTANIENYQQKLSELFGLDIPHISKMRYLLLENASDSKEALLLKCRFIVDDYLPELHKENLESAKSIQKELSKTPEYKELQELELQMRQLQSKISGKKKVINGIKKSIEDESGYTEKYDSEKKLESLKTYYKQKGENISLSAIKHFTGLPAEEFIASVEKEILSNTVINAVKEPVVKKRI